MKFSLGKLTSTVAFENTLEMGGSRNISVAFIAQALLLWAFLSSDSSAENREQHAITETETA